MNRHGSSFVTQSDYVHRTIMWMTLLFFFAKAWWANMHHFLNACPSEIIFWPLCHALRPFFLNLPICNPLSNDLNQFTIKVLVTMTFYIFVVTRSPRDLILLSRDNPVLDILTFSYKWVRHFHVDNLYPKRSFLHPNPKESIHFVFRWILKM